MAEKVIYGLFIKYDEGDADTSQRFTFEYAANKQRDAWNKKYRVKRGENGSAFVVKVKN